MKSTWVSNQKGPLTKGTTVYASFGYINGQTAEVNAQIKMRGSFTATNLGVYLSSLTGTFTLQDRKNTANGSLVISTTTSGLKEDTTHSTTLADGDLYCASVTLTNGHSDACTIRSSGCWVTIDSSTNDYGMVHGNMLGSLSTSVGWISTFGYTGTSGSEADVQFKVSHAITISNCQFYVSAYSFGSSVTVVSRKNGADGNQTISVNSTGFKEDTTNSDTLAADDLFCLSKQSGGTSGTASVHIVACKVSNGYHVPRGCGYLGTLNTDSTTTYYGGAGPAMSSTTESDVQWEENTTEIYQKLKGYFTSNTRTTSTTVTLRANGADTSLTYSIGASSSGWKGSTTESYTPTANDLLCLKSVTSTGGGSLSGRGHYVQQGTGSAPAAGSVPKLYMHYSAMRRAS